MNAERVARNNAIFREANEKIENAANGYEFEGAIPFICECADPACTEVLRLTRSEYEQVRRTPTYFIDAAGHEKHDLPYASVVRREPGYIVVQKVGEAAEIVVELDPREQP